MEQAEYYGYSGNRVKFDFAANWRSQMNCQRKFNEHGWRTLALSGADPEEVQRCNWTFG